MKQDNEKYAKIEILTKRDNKFKELCEKEIIYEGDIAENKYFAVPFIQRQGKEEPCLTDNPHMWDTKYSYRCGPSFGDIMDFILSSYLRLGTINEETKFCSSDELSLEEQDTLEYLNELIKKYEKIKKTLERIPAKELVNLVS